MRLDVLRDELAAVAHLGPVELRSRSAEPAEVRDVVHDSRDAGPGRLFCAVPGLSVDGHDFVGAAVSAGSPAVLVERDVTTGADRILTDRVRPAMAYAAAAVHGHPSRELAVFGITGTNGKTTTTQILQSVLASAGRRCAVIGTLGGLHTTPESTDLQRRLREMVGDGVDSVALEVSSHALDQHRVDAVHFRVAAFSNLTPDHLDYHGDMETYFAAKKLLFDGRAEMELVNVDDPWGRRLADERPDAIRLSLQDVTIEAESIAGTTFRWRGRSAHVPLPGRMNVANALMAAEAARLLGLSEADVVAGLRSTHLVPGRMQTVAPVSPDRPTVVVDYSHTPDSIERALITLRTVAPGRALHIVFGCGGDRDRAKRPLMAAAAESGADHVYLTSDNPRTEDPMAIIAEAMTGFLRPEQVIVEADRRAAIRRAIIDAAPGDVVLVAGKGHEKTQTVGTDVLPFDDVSVALEFLQAAER